MIIDRQTVNPLDLGRPSAPDPDNPPPGTIGIVTGELVRYAMFWRSLQSLVAPKGSSMAQAAGSELPSNRNGLAKAMSGDWLFCLDDDMVIPPNTLQKLLRTLYSGPYDVVSAFCLRRGQPYDALVYMDDPVLDPTGVRPWVPDDRTGVVEIKAGGLGGVLIRRRVFEALEQPYFRVGQVEAAHFHEDVEFFHRVRAAGFRCAVDLDCPVGHVTPMAVWPGRSPDGRFAVALVGHDGLMIPVDPEQLRRSTPQMGLIGL